MISEFTCASGESGRCCGSIGFAGSSESHWLSGSGGPSRSRQSSGSGWDGGSGGSSGSSESCWSCGFCGLDESA